MPQRLADTAAQRQGAGAVRQIAPGQLGTPVAGQARVGLRVGLGEGELGRDRPAVHNRERPDSLPRLKFTLREYYRRKMAFYAGEESSETDRYLLRIFAASSNSRHGTAVSFLRRTRHELRNRVAALT